MKIFSWISDLFLKVFRTLKPIFAAVFHTAFQIFLERVKEIAKQAIIEMAGTNFSNEEKRQAAFNKIKVYAIERALTFSDSDIYLAIELFFKALKNQGVIK